MLGTSEWLYIAYRFVDGSFRQMEGRVVPYTQLFHDNNGRLISLMNDSGWHGFWGYFHVDFTDTEVTAIPIICNVCGLCDRDWNEYKIILNHITGERVYDYWDKWNEFHDSEAFYRNPTMFTMPDVSLTRIHALHALHDYIYASVRLEWGLCPFTRWR